MTQLLPQGVDITYYPEQMFFRISWEKHLYNPFFIKFLKLQGCIYEYGAWTYWWEDHDTILNAIYKTFRRQ